MIDAVVSYQDRPLASVDGLITKSVTKLVTPAIKHMNLKDYKIRQKRPIIPLLVTQEQDLKTRKIGLWIDNML